MARVLERLEVRNGPIGSTDTSVVDIIPDVVSAVTNQQVDGRETYTVGIPLLSTAWAGLVERQVLKNIMSDGTVDSEWRIMALKSARTRGQLNGTIECESIKYDLANTLISRTEDNGDVNNYFELYGLTPTEHLGVILADAPSHFSAGTIASSAPIDMVYDWDNPLSASAEIASLAGLELSIDRTSTGYKVNMPVAIGSTASKVQLRYSRNILGLSRNSDARTEHGTRVYPRGGGDVGDRPTIADAAWLVIATSTVTATLSTADGRAIAFDNQLNNLWVEEPGGTRKQVTDSTTGQVITVASGHNISTGERVKFRTSSGGDQLTYLEDPAQVATYGTVQRVLDRQDIPRVDNLAENPFFTGTYSTAGIPTNWSKVGSLTFAENTSALFRRYGNQSLHITSTAAGRGVISDSIAITPSSASPFFSVQTAIWVVSGSVQLQLIDQSSTQGNVFPPVDSQPANTTVVDTWVENLVVAGIDLSRRSSTALKLQVLALSTGGAEWYMDVAQVTQTPAGAEVFNDGRTSNALWLAGNAYLTDNATPRVTLAVQASDLERLHPADFSNQELVPGGTVQVVDADMGLDFQTRIIGLQRDLLHPGDSQLVISNKPETLSRLFGVPMRRRPFPRAGELLEELRPSIQVERTTAGSTSVSFKIKGVTDRQRLALFHRSIGSSGSSTIAFTRVPTSGWKESGFSSTIEVTRPAALGVFKTFEAYALDEQGSHSDTHSLVVDGDSNDIAEVTGIEITFDEEAEAVVSAVGDEDTTNMYVTVGDGTAPSDPTVGTNDGSISGRTGFVATGVKITTGNDAFVKVVGANSAASLGPVQTSKRRRDLGLFHKDTSIRSHTGDTNLTSLDTIAIPANRLGTEGGVRFEGFLDFDGTAGGKNLVFRFGSTISMTFGVSANRLIATFSMLLFNDGATNVQFARALMTDDQGTNFLGTDTGTEDTTSSVNLEVLVQQNNGADTTKLVMTMVEYIGRN